MLAAEVHSYEAMTERAARAARDEGFAGEADFVVIAACIPFEATGNTNNIRLIQL